MEGNVEDFIIITVIMLGGLVTLAIPKNWYYGWHYCLGFFMGSFVALLRQIL